MKATIILEALNDCSKTTLQQLYGIFIKRSSLELISAVWDGTLGDVVQRSMKETESERLVELQLQLFLRMMDYVKIRPQNLMDAAHSEAVCQTLLHRCGIERIDQLLHFAEEEMLHVLEEQWPKLELVQRSKITEELHIEDVHWQAVATTYKQGIQQQGYRFMRSFIQTLTRFAPSLQWPICYLTVLPNETRYEQTAQQFLAYRFSNKQMKHEMLPDLIVQLVLPYVLNERARPVRHIESRWQNIIDLHTRLTRAANQLMETHRKAEHQLNTFGDRLHACERKIILERGKQRQAWEQLVMQLMQTANVPLYEPYTTQITKLRGELQRLQMAKFTKRRTYSLAENVEMTSDRLTHHSKIIAVEQSIQEVFEQLADALLVSEIMYDEMQQLFYELATKEIAYLQQEIHRMEEAMIDRQKEMKAIIPNVHQLESQRFELENTYRLLYTFSD